MEGKGKTLMALAIRESSCEGQQFHVADKDLTSLLMKTAGRPLFLTLFMIFMLYT